MYSEALAAQNRLSICLFIAAAAHGVLILALSFSSELKQQNTESIEVTISVATDPNVKTQADFIAATQQLGSGTEAQAMQMTTPDRPDFLTNTYQPIISQDATAHPQHEETSTLLTTTAADPETARLRQTSPSPSPQVPIWEKIDTQALAREIASLEARIAANKQALAKMLRIKRISSVSTRSAAEAAYLNMWRQKCERIGRANYPPGALEGEVLMLVSIRHDGQLGDVRILKSSGRRALDQAALATVRQAAPYQPFTVEMRKAYDVLEFTRTWQFSTRGSALRG